MLSEVDDYKTEYFIFTQTCFVQEMPKGIIERHLKILRYSYLKKCLSVSVSKCLEKSFSIASFGDLDTFKVNLF